MTDFAKENGVTLQKTPPFYPSANPVETFMRPLGKAMKIVALEEVVLGNGYLVDAMMASMSVPGALPPYKLNGHMLVDGGVVNNMPVDVARAMGADVVIAVR